MWKAKTWACRVAVSAALALTAAGARADDAPTIDQALKNQAPGILKQLAERRDQNVAVLKFLADYGDGQLRDNVDLLNRTLADRLKVALVLALTDDDERSFSILTHASDAVDASGDKTLNHRTETGRAGFFSDHPPVFPRAWVRPGQTKLAVADAFLTGEAVVAEDWKSMRVRIQLFDRTAPKSLQTIGDWVVVSVDPRTLTEMDASYSHKKGVPDDPDDAPAQQVAKLDVLTPTIPGAPALPQEEEKKKQEAWDKFLQDSPVTLQIRYNGKEAPIREGAVETPTADDSVSFHLKNNDPNTTYGVVLKINGESSIDRQKLAPLDCYKWVLAPGREIAIDGYQMDGESAKGFKVLAPTTSKTQETNYGDDAGVFSLVVFREAGKDDAAVVRQDQKRDEEVKAISRGSLTTRGEQPPRSLKGLQDELTPAALSSAPSKGIIVPEDKDHPSKIDHVDFTPFPRPEWSLVVRYYQPQK
jgi:hypothetical protein